MKTVFIVSEYNPFHLGHEYMISRIREMLGGVTVVAVMSTSFVQRGEPALFPCEVRAKAALLCGADLVLSLPFPYSASGARYFSRAGVRIADSFEGEKYLAFGSECGDIELLSRVSDRINSDDFKTRLNERPQSEPQALAAVRIYKELYGEDGAEILTSPNNVLALEYIAAINAFESDLVPVTIKREGGEYKNADFSIPRPSATALRQALADGDMEAFFRGVPSSATYIYKEAIENGEYSLGWGRLSSALLAKLRLSSAEELDKTAEFTAGLAPRLISAAEKAADADEFFALAATKHYTNARIRRAVLSALLGVTESDVSDLPCAVRVLASNQKGFEVLGRAKSDVIKIITKPSDYLNDDRYSLLVRRAQALYDLSLEKSRGALDFMRRSPYIEK